MGRRLISKIVLFGHAPLPRSYLICGKGEVADVWTSLKKAVLTISNVYHTKHDKLQNPSIADILYSGQLSIAETFFRNHLFHAAVKFLYFEPLYSGHLSIADTIQRTNLKREIRNFSLNIFT